MSEPTNMNDLLSEIREVTKKSKSVNKVDEVRVMRTMLNDPDFKVGIYDKNKGYVGQRSPREEAVKFIGSAAAVITGLETNNATELASQYEFTNRDATFFVNNAKDYVSTYLSSGRKLPLIQNETSEAALFLDHKEQKEKQCPNGSSTIVPAFDKVVARSKCPKYAGQEENK